MIHTAEESARMDRVTALCRPVLEALQGSELDKALAGHCKRYGKSDSAFRTHAICYMHPDDLAEALGVKP
jgi:hypothetical protein